MNLSDLTQNNLALLQNSSYPGRGIIIGMTPDSQNYIQIYWIMGRSENSRNRVFVNEKWFVKTAAFDEQKMTDPSLIIYYPVKFYGGWHIVSNGDQTDTILEYLRTGKSFEAAMNSREVEPDAPNYTPRIASLLDLNDAPYVYKMAIIKTLDNNPAHWERHFFNYMTYPGIGHCIHTYAGDGNPLPPFTGEPFVVEVYDSIEETTQVYWETLNPENRVSLVVKYINVTNGEVNIRIRNKNLGD